MDAESAVDIIKNHMVPYLEEKQLSMPDPRDGVKLYTKEEAKMINEGFSKQLYWTLSKAATANPLREDTIGESAAMDVIRTFQSESYAEAMSKAHPLDIVGKKKIKYGNETTQEKEKKSPQKKEDKS